MTTTLTVPSVAPRVERTMSPLIRFREQIDAVTASAHAHLTQHEARVEVPSDVTAGHLQVVITQYNAKNLRVRSELDYRNRLWLIFS